MYSKVYCIIHISFGRLGNALQYDGTSATLGWNGIKGSRCRQVYVLMIFIEALHISPMVFLSIHYHSAYTISVLFRKPLPIRWHQLPSCYAFSKGI